MAFSFYGNPKSKLGKERKYFLGIKENLELLPKYYKDWNIRVYYDIPEKSSLLQDLCSLACNNPDIDLCYVRDIPSSGDVSKVFAMNWRFLPLIDPQVSNEVTSDKKFDTKTASLKQPY